jgi:hypothetical protein
MKLPPFILLNLIELFDDLLEVWFNGRIKNKPFIPNTSLGFGINGG